MCKLPSELQAINRRQTKKNKPEQMIIVPFEIEKSNEPMRNKQIGIIWNCSKGVAINIFLYN